MAIVFDNFVTVQIVSLCFNGQYATLNLLTTILMGGENTHG